MSFQPTNIKPFDGTNFPNWLYRVERLLERNSVLNLITEDPPQVDKTESAGAKAAEGKASLDAWKKSDAIARDLIVQWITDKVLELVKRKTTAKLMIETLRSTYVKEGLRSKVQIKKKLRNMCFTGQSSLNEYLIEFEQTVK